MILRPFFSYYGSKWRIANRYPTPKYATIIEPFAGSAGYSLNYSDRHVVLCDINPQVSEVWRYLIRASEHDILSLPNVPLSQDFHIDDLKLSQEARWLIGFWLGRAGEYPRTTPSAWMLSGEWPKRFWGEYTRNRIANHLRYIRHWIALNCDYSRIPRDNRSTWFIDPPYTSAAGRSYRYKSIDYQHLGGWARSRQGQVIACEGDSGADWLPFKSIGRAQGRRFDSVEVSYVQG